MASALDRFDRAIAVAKVDANPVLESVLRSQERVARIGRANALERFGRLADATNEWDSVVKLSADDSRAGVRFLRAASAARAGRIDEALRNAEVVDQGAPPQFFFDSACAFALVYARTKNDTHADRAVELLQAAITKGWNHPFHMRQDPDLNSLRGRADFQRISRDLQTARPPMGQAEMSGNEEGPEKEPGATKGRESPRGEGAR